MNTELSYYHHDLQSAFKEAEAKFKLNISGQSIAKREQCINEILYDLMREMQNLCDSLIAKLNKSDYSVPAKKIAIRLDALANKTINNDSDAYKKYRMIRIIDCLDDVINGYENYSNSNLVLIWSYATTLNGMIF